MTSKTLFLAFLTVFSFWSLTPQKGYSAQVQSPTCPCSTSSEAVEKIVLKLLDKNPKIVLTALKKAVEQEEKEKLQDQEQLVQKHKAELLAPNPSLPTSGNPKGDIKIVAFFDYQCGYCKKSEQTLADILKKDPNVQVIYKEMPIFGKESNTLSQIALSAQIQGKYLCLHTSFMNHKGPLTDPVAFNLAEKCGLDLAQLKKDMTSENVQKSLSQNKQLAETLQIEAAPFFIVGEKIVPGFLSQETLQKAISEQRNPSKPALSPSSSH